MAERNRYHPWASVHSIADGTGIIPLHLRTTSACLLLANTYLLPTRLARTRGKEGKKRSRKMMTGGGKREEAWTRIQLVPTLALREILGPVSGTFIR